MSKLVSTFVVTLLVVALAHADATKQSELSCVQTEVEPKQNITCYIYVRDDQQEPTTIFSVNDFTARVLTETPGVRVTIFPMTVTADPTVVAFEVSAETGSSVRIDVILSSTGAFIDGSGFVAAVLTWPATVLGKITCDTNRLELRNSTVCRVPAFGQYGTPALVRVGDIFFSEDHSEGSFQFVSGHRELVFRYTSPNFPSMAYSDFSLRVSLILTSTGANISLPMAYPNLPPTKRSSLKCTSDVTTVCLVSAADDVGPVAFNPNHFFVIFERLFAEDGNWYPIDGDVSYGWMPAALGSMGRLFITPVRKDLVFSARVIVQVQGEPIAIKETILGAPFAFRVGVPPTSSHISFRGCGTSFLSSYNTTTCILDVASGVSADPRFVVVSPVVGGTVSKLTFQNDSETGGATLVFTYTAPAVETRSDEFIVVRVQGTDILRSPWKLVLYPMVKKRETTEDAQKEDDRILVLGTVFYGGVMLFGLFLCIMRKRRITRVKQLRLAKAIMEMKQREQEMRQQAETEIEAEEQGKTGKRVKIAEKREVEPEPPSLRPCATLFGDLDD